ncbi:leucine-rich PPR motif-containing protein, mitochondrial [Contarinia nasturtii]|uniref:leucine-rich PPR motif-containing protein, mitochondrial n=1 Tax=Contarinia nasturtii TaxID=265458 RepID=UPI0012D39712|nr:leucine-rich PPR motif-containing protein, mitochondrial [Contarinia nasturtii]
MSYITKKLSGVIFCNLSRSFAPKSFNYYYTKDLKIFSTRSNYFLPNVSFSSQIQTYAKIDENHIPNILKKLTLNNVSLQFDKIIQIRPNLFKNYGINVENGFKILKSCSQLIDRSAEERIKLVNDVWNELLKIIGTPTKDHLILLLKAYRQAGLKKMDNYHSFFEKYNCTIDADIFGELMYIMCKNGDTMESAEALLKEIEILDIQLNDQVYNALILGYSKQGIDSVKNVLKTMESKKITPTLDTQTELIKSYIKHGYNDTAMELLQQFRDYNSDQLYDIIRCGAHNNNEAIVSNALSLLPQTIINAKMIERNIQNICIELIHSNRNRSNEVKVDLYKFIIRHLPVPKQQMDDNSSEYGTFLIREMVVTKEIEANIFQFCENLIESERNSYSFHACCMYSLMFNFPKSRAFLEALAAREPLRPHYFWPLYIHANTQNEVVEIIRFGKKLNAIPDTITILKWILPRANTLINSEETINTLAEAGVRMHELKTAAITYLLSKHRPREALNIASRSSAYIDPFPFVQPAISNYFRSPNYKRNVGPAVTLIKKLRCRDKEYDLAGEAILSICTKKDQTAGFPLTQKILTDFAFHKVKISAHAANKILSRLSKHRQVHEKFGSVVQNLICYDMFPNTQTTSDTIKIGSEVETLQKQLNEFKENGLPTHGILYRLFLKHVQYEQYDQAIEIKKECDKVGVVSETPAMLSSLLKLWTATNLDDEALRVLKILTSKHPHFKVDYYKIIDLATLLLSKNRLEDGNELIKCLDVCRTDNSHLIKNIWALLEAASEYSIRHNKEENLAGQFLNVLVKNGYCDYSNILLGCVIKEYVHKKQIHEAFAAFQHFANEYKSTPHFQNLLMLLIEILNDENKMEYNITKQNAIEYMQRLIDLGQQVHGTQNSNCNVIVAFATVGNDEQVRKMLMDPNVKFNSEFIMKTLSYLKGQMQISAVTRIARCARGLNHTSLNEEKLYLLLLNNFVRTNDCKMAVNLFYELEQDDSSVISKNFKRTLADLLKKNKQKLPEKLSTY